MSNYVDIHVNKISVVEVSNLFITLSLQENIPINKTFLKNLIYMSYGWFSTFSNNPLLNEKFFASKNGLKLLSLDRLFNDNIIEEQIIEMKMVKRDNNFYAEYIIAIPEDRGMLLFLHKIWDMYKNYKEEDFYIYTESELSPCQIILAIENFENNSKTSIPLMLETIQQQFYNLFKR